MRAQIVVQGIVSILILTVISLIPSSYAQVLFSDNFDDNDISEYQQFGGTWTTVLEAGSDYVLRHTSNSNTVIFPQSESFSNSYQVIAEIWNEDNDAGGVAFGINPADPDNLYSCSASSDSAFNSGIWEHVNDVNGPPTNQLATQSWNYKRSTWYTVTITIDQNTNTINCTWESQAGIELDVTAPIPNPTPSGSVGIWLSHQDNFKGDLLEVRSLGPPDTEFPVLSVQDPINNMAYEISEVPLNYVVSDNVGLSGCSYVLDNGITTSLPNCQNSILSSLTLSPPSHSITVSATDTSGNTSTSPPITFFVNKDTSPPQWNPDPENIVLLKGQPLFYDADATDNVAVASFSIDDTTNFKIDPISGILENNIPLSVTTYPLSLSVSDTSGNVNTKSISIIVQAVGVTPPGYKVAFIADQGSGSSATAVLNVILNEGADMVMHQGDFDYGDNPDAWDAKITSVLGPDFPYFASVGNHDDGSAVWSAYQQKLTDRLALIDGAVCTFGSGGIGVKQSCTYNGLFFVLSGVGTLESNHATYIQNEMANDNSIWRICSWHKNMNAMQLGTKGDSTGWEVYEECRMAGAIVATGHEHTYSRTRTLSSVQNQIVDPAWPDTNNVRVGEGSTFVFVAGLGGAGMRDQNRCLPFTFPYGCNGEWASIYTTDQNSKHGALFCSFNVGGQANKAHCYFKDIDGNIPDQFDVTSFNIASDVSPPTVTSAITSSTTSIDLTMSENVVDNSATPGDFTVLGAASPPTVFSILASGNTVTINLIPSLTDTDTITVSYTQTTGSIDDSAGNSLENFAGQSVTNNLDTTSPIPSVTTSEADPTNSNPVSFSVNFGEPINTGTFTTSDISASSGIVQNIVDTGDAQNFTFEILNPTDGATLSVSIPASGIQDTAGNLNSASNTVNIYLDLTAPTVTISSTESNPTSTSPIPMTAEFTEAVIGFDLADISVGNGTPSNLFTSDNITYTFDVTPTAGGTVTVDVGAGVAQDGAANGNTAAAQFSITFDSGIPSVTLSSSASDPTNTSPIQMTAEFTEAVTGFDLADISVGNGTPSNLFTSDNITYTFDVTPTAGGTVTVDVPAGVAQDGAANGNTAATQFSIVFDGTAPSVTLSSSASDPTNTSPIPMTATFSESVTGFAEADITVGNGAVTVLSLSTADNITYTFSVTPTADGTVTVDVGAGVAQDGAANGNTAATQFSIVFDGTAPSVTLSSSASDPTNTSPIPMTATFSESVTGFAEADINVGNGAVDGGSLSTTDNITFTFTVTPTAGGTVTVDISGGIATDAAGNPNTAASQFSIEFAAPTPDLLVSVTTNSPNYPPKSFAFITVDVTSSSGIVSGASVTLIITDPNDKVVRTQSSTTDDTVTFKYRISPKATLGTYTVTATASAAGFNSGSDSTTFTVSQS